MNTPNPKPHGKRTVRLGLCPIGKFVFSHEEALVQKSRIIEVLRGAGVSFCDIDGVVPDGMVREQDHVAPVVRYLREQEIDALFLPHCNFGTEGAAGMIARDCQRPVLLWGPRDDAPQPDGTRLRDTLCGTLATSKVLYSLRVPFSYIHNCALEDVAFATGLDLFVRAVRVVKTLKSMRIGQVGERIDFFWSTVASELDLLQQFGVEVVPLDLADLLRDVGHGAGAKAQAYERELRGLEAILDVGVYPSRDLVYPNFAFRDRLLELAEEHRLDGFCLKTFPSVPNAMDSFLCLGVALLNDLGYPVGPESDLHGAVSSILLEAAGATDEPSFLADVTTRHPSHENAVLLWHFEAPLSLRHPDGNARVGSPWILNDMPPGLLHFRLKDGPLTLCRFDGDSGGYRLGCGEGRTIGGPYTQEFYTWMEVDDWPRWERRLVRGPYIHHASFVYDHCAEVLAEATRFLPGLASERFDADPERIRPG